MIDWKAEYKRLRTHMEQRGHNVWCEWHGPGAPRCTCGLQALLAVTEIDDPVSEETANSWAETTVEKALDGIGVEHERLLTGACAPGELHCSCVPALRQALAELIKTSSPAKPSVGVDPSVLLSAALIFGLQSILVTMDSPNPENRQRVLYTDCVEHVIMLQGIIEQLTSRQETEP